MYFFVRRPIVWCCDARREEEEKSIPNSGMSEPVETMVAREERWLMCKRRLVLSSSCWSQRRLALDDELSRGSSILFAGDRAGELPCSVSGMTIEFKWPKIRASKRNA